MTLKALDLFAGTGWGVACKIHGIDEVGVEIIPEAIATRAANGMVTAYRDVWDGLEGRVEVPAYDLLIASPPCQTFSMAGKGAGRQALDEVIALIDSRAYLDVAALRAFGEIHDPRTALVLTPLSHVARDAPLYVVLEQVPQVLPVWERMAAELRGWGYSVVVGILNSEQYGVPQTRKRAILIARADGVEAVMPTPTHSAYYPRDKARLDPGVRPWVSMAQALGWLNGLVGFARLADDKGAATEDGYRARDLRETDEPAQVVTEKARSWMRASNQEHAAVRADDEPAPTIHARGPRSGMRFEQQAGHTDRAAFIGHQYPDSKGSRPTKERQRRETDRPAPSITSGSRSALWEERVNDQSGTERDEAWPVARPSTVVTTRDLITDPGANANRFNGATKSRNDGIRVTVAEAARLQSYPATFIWDGLTYVNDKGRTVPVSKTAEFRQIGNAVPPLLAWHVLNTLPLKG